MNKILSTGTLIKNRCMKTQTQAVNQHPEAPGDQTNKGDEAKKTCLVYLSTH